MIYKYAVDLAVCWQDGQWTWERINISSATPLSDSVLHETVSMNYFLHPKHGTVVTTGLIGVLELEGENV